MLMELNLHTRNKDNICLLDFYGKEYNFCQNLNSNCILYAII